MILKAKIIKRPCRAVFLFILFAISICSFKTAFAQAQVYQVMSYDQIVKMPEVERMNYVKGLQYLSVELESFENTDQSRQPQALGLGMPVLGTNGRSVICPGSFVNSNYRLTARRVFEHKSKGIFEKFKRIVYGQIFSEKSYEQFNRVEDPKDFICTLKIPETGECPSGFVPVSTEDAVAKKAQVNFRFFCATEPSFAALPASRQKELQKDIAPVIARHKFIQQLAPVIGQQQSQKKNLCREREIDKEIDAKVCNEKSVAQVRSKFYRGPDKLCIYGGNLSQYEKGEKKVGGCAPRSQFCMESLDCRNSSTGEKWKPTYRCGNDQIICNPLLFGLKSDGETPFCVSRSGSATADCESLSESSPKARHPFQSQQAGSEREWRNQVGFANAWNDFAKGFNQICFKDLLGAQFFCRECHTIKKRLSSMNSVIGNSLACKQPETLKKSRVSGIK